MLACSKKLETLLLKKSLSPYTTAFSTPTLRMASQSGVILKSNSLKKLLSCKKKAVRAISFAPFNAPFKPLFKSLGLLKFDDLVHYKTTSLLWDVDHGTIPPTLSTYFKKTESRHHHATRQATSGKYHTVKKIDQNWQSFVSKYWNRYS